MAKQTFQINSTAAETEIFDLNSGAIGQIKVTVCCVGCDALIDFGPTPDADNNGGVVPGGTVFEATAVPDRDKASFKAISGSGWITFYY